MNVEIQEAITIAIKRVSLPLSSSSTKSIAMENYSALKPNYNKGNNTINAKNHTSKIRD